MKKSLLVLFITGEAMAMHLDPTKSFAKRDHQLLDMNVRNDIGSKLSTLSLSMLNK